MQCKEPASGLIHSLCNKIGRKTQTLIDVVLVFERIVQLCVRHCSRIEPYVDQILFPDHLFAFGRNQNDVIYIRTVEVDLVVVLL